MRTGLVKLLKFCKCKLCGLYFVVALSVQARSAQREFGISLNLYVLETKIAEFANSVERS